MIKEGFFEEAKKLNSFEFSKEKMLNFGIGYSRLIDFFNKKYSIFDAINFIKQDTRHYAKRQINNIKLLNLLKILIWSNYEYFNGTFSERSNRSRSLCRRINRKINR